MSSIKKFKIFSSGETNLSKLGANKILLTKIKQLNPSSGPFLSYTISVLTRLPNQTKTEAIVPGNYIDIMSPSSLQRDTVRLAKVISHCKHSSMQIFADVKLLIEYELTYETIKPQTIKVYVSKSIEGFSFALSPDSNTILKETFPNTRSARNIVAPNVALRDFKKQNESFIDYFLSALTGLGEEQLNFFDFVYLDSNSGETLMTR